MRKRQTGMRTSSSVRCPDRRIGATVTFYRRPDSSRPSIRAGTTALRTAMEGSLEVVYEEQISPNHRIEIGWSTWDSDEVSIRNRYDSPTGHFSNTASNEIPIRDLPQIIRIAIERLPEVLATHAPSGATH